MYLEVWIEKTVQDIFKKLIPAYYEELIKKGDLVGIGFCDDRDPDDVIVIGVVLFRKRPGLIEIVWVSVTDTFIGSFATSDMINSIVVKSGLESQVVGLYAEVPTDEEDLLEALEIAGFEIEQTPSGVYELDMSMVRRDILKGAAKHMSECISIKKADRHMKAELEERLKADSRNLPVDIPIKYGEYDEDLSFIYLGKNAAGLVLAKKYDSHVLLEVVISQSPANFVVLIASFIEAFDRVCDKNMKISIPVVSQEADGLVKKIVPGAKQGEICQAYYFF